jgi:hypothetical protein
MSPSWPALGIAERSAPDIGRTLIAELDRVRPSMEFHHLAAVDGGINVDGA